MFPTSFPLVKRCAERKSLHVLIAACIRTPPVTPAALHMGWMAHPGVVGCFGEQPTHSEHSNRECV